jgi:hypothetical protein
VDAHTPLDSECSEYIGCSECIVSVMSVSMESAVSILYIYLDVDAHTHWIVSVVSILGAVSV